MNLGRFQQGDWVGLFAELSGSPSDCPEANVYDCSATSSPITSIKLPFVGLNQFCARVLVDERFEPGKRYVVVVAGRLMWFDVVPGGDPDGAVISQTTAERPEGTSIVALLDSGKVKAYRNPR